MIDVSVIIVNFNTKELTKNCIDSVFHWTKRISFEVILVDNASSDGSKEFFMKDDRITYIYNEENLGFGKANNIGVSKSHGKSIFLLNSDTYLLNDAISVLYEGINRIGTNKACVGCLLLDSYGEIAHSYGRFPTKSRLLINYTIQPILSRLHLSDCLRSTSNYNYEIVRGSKFFEVDYITGADLMLGREIIDAYGLFDEDFFLYFEETEMQHRFASHGIKRIIIEGAQIVHLEGKSGHSQSIRKKTIVLSSLFKYVRKTSPKSIASLYVFGFKVIYVTLGVVGLPFNSGSIKEKINHLAIISRL